MENVNLTDHFLIAMPNMVDPFFAKTLTYICEHNERGALGLVINRPTDLSLEKFFDQLGIPRMETFPKGHTVLFGGPVQIDSGFVLHRPIGNWKSTLAVNPTLGLTSSVDIFNAIANSEGPEEMLVTLGYSGWAPGQIEQELAQNAWLTVPASHRIIFEMTFEERLPEAIKLLGINFSNLSNQIGHAQLHHEASNLNSMIASDLESALDMIDAPQHDSHGTVLAFDFGKRYIGIAIGERELKLAHPLTTINSHVTKIQFEAITKLINDWTPKLLVVGLPLHDDGTENEMTRLSKLFARRLEGRYRIQVVMVDERFTTRSARSTLNELGIHRQQHDRFIDQLAAQQILQSFFDHVPTVT